MSSEGHRGRMVAVGVVAALVWLGLVVWAISVDEGNDRKRAMYADLERMEQLQYLALGRTGSGKALDIDDTQRAVVGGVAFTPSAGVRVEVRTPEAGRFCVRVSNEHGDTSRWTCGDEASAPEPAVDPVLGG